jgi:hypothetical protein
MSPDVKSSQISSEETYFLDEEVKIGIFSYVCEQNALGAVADAKKGGGHH